MDSDCHSDIHVLFSRRICYAIGMRIPPADLTFKALVALDEVLDGGPVTQGVRFALAYLYAVSDGERVMFDQFWRAARRPKADNTADDFARRQVLNAALNGICLGLGVVRDVELDRAMRRARAGRGD